MPKYHALGLYTTILHRARTWTRDGRTQRLSAKFCLEQRTNRNLEINWSRSQQRS